MDELVHHALPEYGCSVAAPVEAVIVAAEASDATGHVIVVRLPDGSTSSFVTPLAPPPPGRNRRERRANAARRQRGLPYLGATI